ncbi:MAG: Glutamine--fructose-6-phosphate aminotransferase [Pseudomonadota bacterium]|jgi:glucosamine--fructose-6-phosphate aminotransferase (isomerizing)
MTQSHMLSEVSEQPRIMRRQAEAWKNRAAQLRELLLTRRQIILVGRGSSGNAALYFTYLWATTSGRQPLDFRLWVAQDGNSAGDYSDCGVIAYSASGQSTDVVRACAWLKQRGAVVVGVTAAADAGCRLGTVCDELFLLNCGIEKAVPATKSFMSQMAASAALSGLPLHERAGAIATSIEKTIVSPASNQLAQFISGARTVIMLGRGHLLGAVHDAALKLQETTGLASFAYSTAEFFHGPLGCVSESDRAIIFASGDTDLEQRLLISLAERGVPVRLVVRGVAANNPSVAFSQLFAERGMGGLFEVIELPTTGNDWSDVFALIALAQMTCLSLCGQMGRSPDAPPLLKKVTET